MTILSKLFQTVLGPPEAMPPVPVDRLRPIAAAPVPPYSRDEPPDVFPREDERDAERFVPDLTNTVMTMTSGRRVAARIVNVSRTGVALEAETRDAAAWDVAMVGNRKVRPGRRIGIGLVFVFEKPIDARQCHPGIVL